MNDQIKPIEFDVQGALRAGYTPSEIAAHLGQLAGFDVDKARKAGYTDQELVSQLAAPKPQQAPEGQDFTRGFGVAMGQLAPLAKGAVGLAGATAEKAFGAGGAATAVKEWGLKGYQEGMAKLQPMQRETDDLTTAWDRAKQGDLGALVDWAQYGLGYSAGQLVQSGAVAVAGGLLGAAAGGPAGATAGAVTGAVEPTIIKAAAQKLIQGAVAKEMATLAATEAGRSMSKEALQAAATKAVASSIGQGVGLTGMAGVQELGSIYPEAEAQAKAEGRQLDGSDLARVWATGIGAAALEGLIDKLGADALLGKVRLPGNGGRLARAATGAAAAGAVEGGTEFAQTALERVGAGQPLTGQDATSDYVNSVALGVIGGAPVGGVSGALHAQQRAARDAQDQQSIQKLAGAQSIDEVVAAAEELTRASDQLAPAVSAFRGEAPAAGQAGAGGPIATPAATQVATPAPVEAPTGFVGPQQFPVGPLEQRRQNLDRQSELLGQANTAGFAAEREQALAQERVARGGPTDRGAAADFADLAPMPKKQAQARLLVLREQEGGDRPMDLVVAKHPNVPGAYAIRRLPPVVAAAPTPATGPSAQEAQARLEKASLEGTVAARKAEDQPRQDIVSKAMKSIEARGGVASPEEARIVQEAGLGKPYDRVDASLSTPLTEDQRLTQATGIALQKSPKETTVPGKASALAAEKAQMEADAAAAKARGDAAREAKRVADNDASMAKREKQQAFSAAASPIGQAALERQAAQPKAAPAAHAVVDILRHPPFQRTPEQRATLADARQTHGVETMKLFDKAANSPFELSAPEKMRLKSLGYDTNTDARAAETHESPTNKLLATREQVLAGNAPLGHIRIAGMGISVENNAGSMRVDKHNVPPKWKQKLKHHYGYFKGTIGKDKDHVDVFVVPGTPENFDGSVFVVDQKNAKGGFDEHKVVLGATNLEHARQVYLANYAPGWKGLKNITEMPMSRFKAWVYDKEQTKREAAKIAPAAGKKESPQRGVDINSLPPVSRSETRQIGDNTVKVHTLSRPVALALNQFAKLFGHRIELFTDANAGDGFVTSDDPTVIHLNTESSMPHIAVLGHEVMHQLRKANPEAYKAVEAVVRAQLTDGAAEDFAAYYGQGAQDLTEEMVSDLLGNRWMEPEFLSGVFDALRQKHGEAAGGMIDALAKAIRATIDAMLRVLNGQRAFRTDAMVKDLDAVREALKTALANYAEQKRGAPIEQARDEATGQFIASEKRAIVDQDTEEWAKRLFDTTLYGGRYGARIEDLEKGLKKIHWGTRGQEAKLELEKAVSALRGTGGVTLEEFLAQIPARDPSSTGRGHAMFGVGHGSDRVAVDGGAVWVQAAVKDADGVNAYLVGDATPGVDAEAAFSELSAKYPSRRLMWLTPRGEDLRKKAFKDQGGRDADFAARMNAAAEKAGYSVEETSFSTNTMPYLLESLKARGTLDSLPQGMEPNLKEAGSFATAYFVDLRKSSAKRGANPISVVGVHYSKQQHPVLTTAAAGSNYLGAERERGAGKDRLYFYVDTGSGVRPEEGVGSYAHKATLTNLYDAGSDPEYLAEDSKGLNDFEQRVVAAGYDGYYKPDFRTDEGAAVLLGRHEVKAEFVGRGSLPPSGERPQRAARVNEGWRATAEAFRENDKLPSGNVLAKDWPARVQRVDAELYDQMADSGLWDRLLASNDRLYKDEVLREYKQLVGQQNSTKRHEYVSKHLTPAEQAKMRGAIADRVVKLFDALPSGNEIAAAAWAGRAKRGWYKQSAQAISHVFGPDAPRFAALLAALSPQQSVETNLENAVRVWKGWVKAGRPTDREAILTAAGKHVLGSKGRGSILEAWENNMVRALSHEDPIKVTLSGPKVDSFMRNLLGDVEAVTLDAWMANYSLVEQQLFSGRMPRQDKGGSNDPGKGTGYLAMSARVREAARLLTKYTGEEWTPAEVQETVWSWAKTLYETQAAEGEPRGARELVLDKAITDEMIAATPDFGSLLNDEQYAKHIREVGLDPAAGRAAVAAKPSTAGQKAPFADDAQQRYESQAARRLERLHAEGKDAFATRRELIRESAKRSASEAFSPENVKDLLEHDDWAVLTASDPNATKTSDADNAIANKLLEDDLRSMGVDFLPAVGKYGDVQDSYVITGITREQATMLGQRYGQESVLTRDGLVYSDARPDTPATGVTTFDTPPDDFYTEVPSTGAKFSLDLQFSSKREEDLGEFRKRMLDEVKARAETTKVLVRQHDWRFNVGDQFLSVKTGKTYELTGRTIQKHREFNAETKKLGEPRMTAMYYYEGRDGERGTFVESKMLNSTTLIPLTTPKWSPRRHAFGTLTTGQEAALRNVGGLTTPQTIQQRWAKAKDGLGMRVRQELVDQFAPLAELDPTAYMLARMSKGSDGTLEAAMLYGKPFLDASGVADVNINDGGFAKVLASLEGEHDRFLWWVAAQRAEGLKAIGLENLFSRTDIQELKSLDQGNLANGQPRSRVYADSLTKLNEFNEAVLRLSRDSGLIDDSAYQLLKDLPYVPFYRVMEDEQAMTGPRFSSGLVNQRAWKKLKGGSQKLNDDLLANVLQNWGHLYDAAAKNRAAVRSLRAAEAMGLAFESPVAGKGTVRVLEQGKTKYFVIDDPQVYGAVSSLEYVAPSWFKPLTTFKRWLTLGVTASPAFKIRNLLRDSLSAVAQSPLSGNVLKNVSSGWKDTNTKTSQTYASMLASGGVIRFGTMLEGDRATRAHDLVVRAGGKILDEKGFAKLTRQMHGVLHAYNELGDRSENLNRVALYKQLRADGYDHAEASFMARDLLDFSLSGRAPVMRFLAQTVPFFNARLQGLYKLGRAAKDDPKKFAAVAGGVVAASMALMLAYKDDEDWKQREDWDRDNYWWFKIGDTAYRIPKPFEVGAIGTLAERTWEMAFDKEMDAHRYGQRLSNMLFQTFAFDPTPQVVKPLLDVYANQDSFTGRSIETESLKNLRPEDRVTASTSSVARVLGLLGLPDPAQLAKGRYDPLSPVQIDYLTRAYFGWMGATATAFVDAGMRPLTGRGERPDYTLKDLSLGFAETQPGLQSRYVTAFYEQAKEIDQAWASFRAAQKQGDGDLARTILEDEGGKLAAREMVDRSKKRLAEINARMRMVEASTTMSGDQKRTTLNLLTEQRNALAKGALAGVPR